MRRSGFAAKWPWFILEGLNSLGCAFYFNYLFFQLRGQFLLSPQGSLALAACHGLIYTFAAHGAGRFAQRFGYRFSLGLGSLGMILSLGVGWMGMSQWWIQCAALVGWTIAVCFTWPPLQALSTENETAPSTAHLVGIYNLVWSGCAALANFLGGWFFERLGPGSLYYLPMLAWGAMLAGIQLIPRTTSQPISQPSPAPHDTATEAAHPGQPAQHGLFLRLSWVANPLAYIAINTLVPLIPQIADRLHLSVAQSGWFNSTWFFARTASFALLWWWTGWHWKKSWLLTSLMAMVMSFACATLSSHAGLVFVAQLVFGVAVGLIYYSSLYYSMNAGEEKGARGGIHEAAIGLGTFLGLAVGAAALQLKPAESGWAPILVCGLLTAGVAGVLHLTRKAR